MATISPAELPRTALLRKYVGGPGYTDCYVTEVPAAVSQEAFIGAFYTTPLFKIERALLKWFAARPSTDEDALALARGSADAFAAWRVEARTEDQILLADFTGRTRSWLMSGGTRLYFGSAIAPRRDAGTRKARLGLAFTALLGFHRLYSHMLLRAARKRVLRGRA
jgi:hypothetical protein